MLRSVIRGTGISIPSRCIDNHRMARLMDTSDEWIQRRTGIVTRHMAEADQTTSDLAVPAARGALQEAGLEEREVDYLLVATMTPDFYLPGAAPLIQHKLGLPSIPCLDIRQQCAGFIYGLQLADVLVRSGQYRNVLLVGAEVHGGFMPWTSWDVLFGESDRTVPDDEFSRNSLYRDRTVIFGDGAGAFLLSGESGDRGFEDVQVGADGSLAKAMWLPAGGSAYRPYVSPEMCESGQIVPILEGREVFKVAVEMMPNAVEAILSRNGYGIDDVSLLVMHQANLRINEAVQKRLGLPDEKVFNNIQKYGNTTAATLPLVFHEARHQRGLKSGDLVCFVALGSGLTWGAALYRV